MRPLPSYFEDFRPGDRFTSEPRPVTDADLAHMIEASGDRHRLHTDPAYAQNAGFAKPLLHGPFGIAAFLGWFTSSGIAAETVLAMLDSNWRYLGPIMVGDALSFEMTITRCRRSGKGDRGIVGRHVRVRNAAGTLVQEGCTAMLVRARGSEGDARAGVLHAGLDAAGGRESRRKRGIPQRDGHVGRRFRPGVRRGRGAFPHL